jgi:hypothetical protein
MSDGMTRLAEKTRMNIGRQEESIVNAPMAARTMTGINGKTVYAIPRERLRRILEKYGRLTK